MNQIIGVFLTLIWIAIAACVFVRPSFTEAREVPLMGLDALKIFNKTRYVEWERSDVIQYSFDQLNTAINYLFVAASALLGLILKVLVEPLFDDKKLKLDPIIQTLLIHSSYGCLLSIALGFYAKAFFNDLLMKSSFSFYNSELSLAALFQIISFLLAALLLLFSTKRLIKIYYR